VPLRHDPRLVRGLDYYTRTTFEFQVASLGAQDAVGGGGRYDGLAEDLGWGERFPGVGFGLGVDRILLALAGGGSPLPSRVDAFVVQADASLTGEVFALVAELRRAGIATDRGFDGRSVKAQFKLADRAGARWALVLGSDEAARGVMTVKDLTDGSQSQLPREAIVAHLAGGTTP
jgi:histidyl-tRNA synthetase